MVDTALPSRDVSFERKLKIPRDVFFIGYDNTQLTQIINPPITIVVQPTELIAAHTATILLRRMRCDYAGYPCVLRLRARLTLHESIAPKK